MIFPHGIHVDKDGNIWMTDGQDNKPRRARGAPPDSPLPPAPDETHRPPGVQVQPRRQAADDARHRRRRARARLLLPAERRPGGAQRRHLRIRGTCVDRRIERARAEVRQDRQVPAIVGHVRQGARRVRSAARPRDGLEGAPLRRRPRQQPGRQIFDQDGKYLTEWTQFSRPSGIAIDRQDNIYVADSESGSVNPPHGAWTRGIRIGSAKDGTVRWFIPDQWKTCEQGQRPTPEVPCATNTSSAEGVAVDRAGNVYGAEVGQKALKKYVKK